MPRTLKSSAWKSLDAALWFGGGVAFGSIQFFNKYRPPPSVLGEELLSIPFSFSTSIDPGPPLPRNGRINLC